MSQPKPLRDSYELVKDTKQQLKSNIKSPFDYAVKGNKRFIEEVSKINWESLPSKDVLVMMLMMLSYGLKIDKQSFEDYIKKENMKSSVSIFKFMHDGDGMRIKNCLNTDDFKSIFQKLFNEISDLGSCGKTHSNLCKRVTKIKNKDLSDEDILIVDALINSIIQGHEIEPATIIKNN